MNGEQAQLQDRMARDDLVMFINAGFSCTRQGEFYSGADDIGLSLSFLHQYVCVNYRRLYARVLATGVNHFNRALIITNLLASGAPADAAARTEEGALIYRGLCALPTSRALKLLARLRAAKVNNRRARAVARRYLRELHSLEHVAVKYRRTLRSAARHHHLSLPDEIGDFLFGRLAPRYEMPLLDAYRRAHFSERAIYELPYSVAEGFAQKHGVPRKRFLTRIEPRLTRAERLRLQAAYSEVGVTLEADLGAMPLTRLVLYAMSLAPSVRAEQRDALEQAVAVAARRIASRTSVRFTRVAAVLDVSYSTSGSREKRRRPLALAVATDAVLRALSDEYQAFWTAPTRSPLDAVARGATDLGSPLIDALEWRPSLVVIVSDGYENMVAGSANAVASAYRERLQSRFGAVEIVHVNPVFDADHFEPRRLGPEIPTVGLRDASDLPTMLGFARVATGQTPLSALEDYLGSQVAQWLR